MSEGPTDEKTGIDFTEVDYFINEYSGQNAYEGLLLLKDDSNKDDVGLNYRLANACYILANCSKEWEQRKAYLLEGYGYIKTAYANEPTNTEVLHWAPIITGSLSENCTATKERIQFGHEFKKYIDQAISLLPPEFALLHMRGRFRYEVASLSFVERNLAMLFFGTPPSASYKEALEDLLAAENMDPGAIDNMLYIGKTYHALGDAKNARKWLTKVTKKESCDCVDTEQIEEAHTLLGKLPSPTPEELADDSDCDTAEGIGGEESD
uniref:TPR_REGION domain-containing protein n=1 Tax=Panagrellus redivivus TaxID=6233 RepID=A0A7E4VTN5_PANRE